MNIIHALCINQFITLYRAICDSKYYIINLVTRTIKTTYTWESFSPRLQKYSVLRATKGSSYSIVSCRYIIPQWQRWRRSSYTRFIVICRYLASKKGLPGDSRQSTWSVALQFDAHANVVEDRNYHNDIHICRRIVGIPGRSFYCLESWISRDLEGI